MSAGADVAILSSHRAEGASGAGARALAKAVTGTVIEICEAISQFKFLYDLELSIEEKYRCRLGSGLSSCTQEAKFGKEGGVLGVHGTASL